MSKLNIDDRVLDGEYNGPVTVEIREDLEVTGLDALTEFSEGVTRDVIAAKLAANKAAISAKDASNEVVRAGNEADRAKSEADKAKQVSGLDTVDQAVDMAISEFAGLMSESEARAIQRRNLKHFDASGFVHMGKSFGAGNTVNEGVTAYSSSWQSTDGNRFWLGRGSESSGVSGTSKTDFAVTHIAGAITNILKVGDDYNGESRLASFQLPEAEGGTRTYNKSTGESINHPDAATAFALAATSDDIEVVTHPVDLVALEYYEEELTGRQEVFECIQSLSDTFGKTNVPTVLSTRKLSYFQQYDGQFPEVTANPDFINDHYRCVVWTDLTDKQKREVAAYMGEKLFVGVNGNIVNSRLRARTIRGAGNGDWENINSNNPATDSYLGCGSSSRVNAQGSQDVVTSLGVSTADQYRGSYSTSNDEPCTGVFTVHSGNKESHAYQGRCFLYVVATVPRSNKGAYHPSLNPWGCRRVNGTLGNASGNFWYDAAAIPVKTTADCFNLVDGRSDNVTAGATIASGRISNPNPGHPDGIFYDGIEASGLNGVVDWRLPAIANDSPEEAAKVEAKVENGTYRGLEKLVWTFLTESNNETDATSEYHAIGKVGENDNLLNLLITKITAVDNGAVIGEASEFVVGRVYASGSLYYVRTKGAFPRKTTGHYLVETEEVANLSVSGEFNTQMVIGDPVNILLTDALKDGWLGTWCPVIPDGTSKEFPISRKCLYDGTAIATQDSGTSWATRNVWKPLDSAKNLIVNAAYAEVASVVAVNNYKAFAKQTKPSTSKPVLNATKGLLGVTVTQSHDKAVLAEAVAGIILKSDASGIVTEQSQAVKYLVDGTIKRLKTLPTDMVAPTNSSQAIKIAVYQISNNGQASLATIANTMTHNGTSWGELEEIQIPFGDLTSDTFLDGNKTLQQTICTELAIPTGWTSNRARVGKQIEGVDL